MFRLLNRKVIRGEHDSDSDEDDPQHTTNNTEVGRDSPQPSRSNNANTTAVRRPQSASVSRRQSFAALQRSSSMIATSAADLRYAESTAQLGIAMNASSRGNSRSASRAGSRDDLVNASASHLAVASTNVSSYSIYQPVSQFPVAPHRFSSRIVSAHDPAQAASITYSAREKLMDLRRQQQQQQTPIVQSRRVRRLSNATASQANLFMQQAPVPQAPQQSALTRQYIIRYAEQQYMRNLMSFISISNLRGLGFFMKGSYNQALSCFNRAIFLVPREMSYFLHRAEAHLAIGDVASAIDNFRRVCLSLNKPNYVPLRLSYAYFLRGQSFLDRGKLKPALEQFEHAYRLNRKNDQLCLSMAICHYCLDHFQEAHDFLDGVIQRHETDADVYVLRAKMSHGREDIAAVYSDLEIVRKYNPRHPEIPFLQKIVNDIVVQYRNRAFEFTRIGEPQMAITCLTKAIQIHPNDRMLITQRGLLYGQVGEWEKGIEDLEMIAKRENFDVAKEITLSLAECYFQIGVRHEKDGLVDEAIKCITTAIKYCGNRKVFYSHRAACYERTFHYEKALHDYLRCMVIDPEDKIAPRRFAHINKILGCHAFEAEKYLNALEYLNAVQSIDDADMFIKRAKVIYILGQSEMSINDTIETLKREPGNIEAQEFLLEVICGNDQTKLYNILYQHSIAPFPMDPEGQTIKSRDIDKQADAAVADLPSVSRPMDENVIHLPLKHLVVQNYTNTRNKESEMGQEYDVPPLKGHEPHDLIVRQPKSCGIFVETMKQKKSSKKIQPLEDTDVLQLFSTTITSLPSIDLPPRSLTPSAAFESKLSLSSVSTTFSQKSEDSLSPRKSQLEFMMPHSKQNAVLKKYLRERPNYTDTLEWRRRRQFDSGLAAVAALELEAERDSLLKK